MNEKHFMTETEREWKWNCHTFTNEFPFLIPIIFHPFYLELLLLQPFFWRISQKKKKEKCLNLNFKNLFKWLKDFVKKKNFQESKYLKPLKRKSILFIFINEDWILIDIHAILQLCDITTVWYYYCLILPLFNTTTDMPHHHHEIMNSLLSYIKGLSDPLTQPQAFPDNPFIKKAKAGGCEIL